MFACLIALTVNGRCGIMSLIESLKAMMETSKRPSLCPASLSRCKSGAEPSLKIPPKLPTEQITNYHLPITK
jgi:hypothetical protein